MIMRLLIHEMNVLLCFGITCCIVIKMSYKLMQSHNRVGENMGANIMYFKQSSWQSFRLLVIIILDLLANTRSLRRTIEVVQTPN